MRWPKKWPAPRLKDRPTTTVAGKEGVPSPGGAGQRVTDDGSKFKREFKELMDFCNIKKQVTRGTPTFGAHHPHHQGGHVASHSSRSGL